MKAHVLVIAMTMLLGSNHDAFSMDDIARRSAERRAAEVVIWAMPAVNADLMLQAFQKAGGGPNQIAYWSRLPSWKNQTLTPNPDTVYLMPFFDTSKAGPIILEIPPADTGSLTANIDNLWQVALEDAGPSGADKGKGGKYLILPPGYSKKVPKGYIPLRSDTYAGYALIRSTPKSGSDADVAKAVAYGKRVKLYPLASAARPEETKYVDVIDTLFDATIPYDLNYFQSLDRVIQSEPWLERDRAMIDIVRSLGIEKGKQFRPDADTVATLVKGAEEAHEWLEHQRTVIFEPYYSGAKWFVPAVPDVIQGHSDNFAHKDIYPTDATAVTYSMGYVGIKHLGAGQFYLLTMTDGDGAALEGSKTYRFTVPPQAPVTQYWSATVYDSNTHAFIREVSRFSRSSNSPEIKVNADGAVDVYFGPTAPQGQESNWIPTKPGSHFEVLFRLYGPEKRFFEKSWVLSDLVTVP
ncbi:DUF1254 domain-containing protein [Ochrobactrum sp. RH2CCR150]|uniref:DUF1214 domain-containing protein n=1 Tax=Ochrobactrum sp. RH2CCR150 TaxID=2587044 RepID=UPI0015FDC3E2|nr:hypothetical protein [Ochrobactrum sp. RH2CCR150]